MTERMEPTNRLRWVRRTIWEHGQPDGIGRITFVLQQLWRDPDAAAMGHVVQEWRDVPVEEE